MSKDTQIVKAEPTPQMIFKDQLERNKGSIAQVLNKGLTADRLIKVMLVAAVKNDRLYQCSPTSIVKSIMDAAQLGFELGSPLGHAYAVPYWNKKRNGYDCQMIVGYKGLIKLVVGDEVRKIEARVVYENDYFEVEYGTVDELRHKPNLDNPGAMIAVYAVATMAHGEKQFEVMTRAQVDAIRKRSQSGDSGPWVTDYDEMARKTVAKKLIKYLPIEIEKQEKVARAEAIEVGEDAPIEQSTTQKSSLARKVLEASGHDGDPPPDLDDGGFGGEPPPPPEPPKQQRAPEPTPPREEPPAPPREPAQREIIDAEDVADHTHTPPPPPKTTGPTPNVSETEVAELCKRIFGCANIDDLNKIREELSTRRDKGELLFTKDQGGRVRQALDSKQKTLTATKSE